MGVGALPDMMLQVKALDTIVQGVLHKHSQAAFRVVTFRMETHRDERPTVTNVEQYLELLTAEMDYISHNGGPSQQLKVLQGSPSQGSLSTPPRSGKRPCKFWGTPDGCKHGSDCTYAHSQLPKDGVERWRYCSGQGHRKPDCLALNGQSPDKTGGSQAGQHQHQNSPGGNGGGKEGKGQQKGSTSPPTTPNRKGNGQKGDGSNSKGNDGSNSKEGKGPGKGEKTAEAKPAASKEDGQVKKLDTSTAENLLTEGSTLVKQQTRAITSHLNNHSDEALQEIQPEGDSTT